MTVCVCLMRETVVGYCSSEMVGWTVDETVQRTCSVTLTPFRKTSTLGGGMPPTTVHFRSTPTSAVKRNTPVCIRVPFATPPTDRYTELTFSAATDKPPPTYKLPMPFNFSSHFRKDIELIDGVQRRATKIGKGCGTLNTCITVTDWNIKGY